MTSLPAIKAVGRSIFDTIWAEREHTDPHSELMHVLHGRVEMVTPHYRIGAGPGETLYIPAGTPHRDCFAPQEPFEVYLLIFDWPDEAACLHGHDPRRLVSRGPAGLNIADEFHRLYQDFRSDSPDAVEITSARALVILLSLLRAAAGKPPAGNENRLAGGRSLRIMEQAKDFIRSHYHQPLGLEEIAGALGISSYHLSHVFSRESGFTLSSYLTTVRLENAARLLAEPSLAVTEVASRVGFADAIYFRKVFKNHFGLSPRAYRAAQPLYPGHKQEFPPFEQDFPSCERQSN